MKRGKDVFPWFPLWTDKWLFGSTRHELTHEQRAIWTDLLALANKDEGFIRANSETGYPHEQLAGFLCCSLDLLETTISVCIEKGKLKDVGGGVYYICNWEEYQLSNRYKRMLAPTTPTISPLEEVISEKRKRSILFSSHLSSLQDKEKREEVINKKPEYPAEFGLFWAKYPRRISKTDAFRVWFRLVKKEKVDPALILRAVDGYLHAIKKAHTEERFIKHPATFLNADRWRDYLEGGAEAGASPLSAEDETDRMVRRTGGKV